MIYWGKSRGDVINNSITIKKDTIKRENEV